MIVLHHCSDARFLRPLWTLEETGLPYELHMLPFPPRAAAPDYLAINPLGTIPLLEDGAVRMTESAAICHYLVRVCSLIGASRSSTEVEAGRCRGHGSLRGRCDPPHDGGQGWGATMFAAA
ncbi:glutathione S-transferase N-terminal domain-containing protein [Paracraurococcus sp. LOR1-02]|uniref:Glutathione S-transferase N-terminal domain-containing protein n=2 Tax=Paracraurococcus lichenis TaxID=3064888 RepID=A0ABT9EDL8_9PROT|nr:glutathione S-transferase N-terminal domain-containing protein [Paracraurococcus sp. LOR1-02]MDO9714321.1 glutathione S-transferase N-terminal domain-containing protein [Paracraurococcus sp. LOR1-02]